MTILLNVIMIILILILISVCIALFGVWLEYSVDRDDPKIKFDSFKKFYEINPRRWSLLSQGVKCYTDKYMMYGDIFYFGFWDWIKYTRWRKELEKCQSKQSNAKLTAKMIAAVKQDISNFEALGQQQQDMAVNNIKDIINNLTRGNK